jgi:hypothetical protein
VHALLQLTVAAEVVNQSLAGAATSRKCIALRGERVTERIAESQGRKYRHGRAGEKDRNRSDIPDLNVETARPPLIEVGLNANLDAEAVVLVCTIHKISPRPGSRDYV